MKEFWNRPSRPCAGTGLLTSRHFPDELQGNFLNCNVISFQGIYRVKVSEDGSGLKGETLEPLISSTDPNFRPTAVNVGPDGAVYFCDWQNPIIGHMQHHLRDPNRDHEHGRIYRITCEGRAVSKRPRIDGQSIPALLKLLKEPENQVRELAKVELGKHKTSEVIPAVRKWAAALDSRDSNYQHNLLEALWVQQWHNVLDAELLNRLLHSPDPRARAAAGRVLCYCRDRVPDALALFKTLADDENPRVRLEAVRAASFFQTAEAADVAFTALNHPTDYYLEYTLKETLRQLDSLWKKALENGSPLAARWSEPRYKAARDFVFRTLTTPELLKLPRSPMVLETILSRPEVSDSDRVTALATLAGSKQTGMVSVLFAELDAEGAFSGKLAATDSSQTGTTLGSLSRLLPYQNPDQLKPVRRKLATMTTSSDEELRQHAWAALVLTDDGFDSVWNEAKNPDAQADLLNGIPHLTNPDLRSRAFNRVTPIIEDRAANPAVLRAAIHALVSMSDQHQAAFKILAGLIERKSEVPSAARGLRVIPRPKWQKSEAARAGTALATWCKAVPASDRTTQEFSETVQLANDLASSLPPEQATALRADLQGLKISSFVIRAVREQMRYDTPRLVVEAGKPFEIIFENADFMPHNLVVVEPNTREKVGLAANSMQPEDLDKQKRSYIPSTPGILAATRLLQTGQRQTLKLTAPSVTGDYEYVCTFPGHYQVMWGRLVITKDPEAYLTANPEPVLPSPASEASLDGSPQHPHDHGH
jgi:azurin